MRSLQKSIENGLITHAEVLGLVDTVYHDSLRLLSYSVGENSGKKDFTFYSHAPIDWRVIKAVAELDAFAVPSKSETPKEVEETLEAINVVFQRRLKQSKVHELFEQDILQRAYCGEFGENDLQKYPCEAILWNRDFKCLVRRSPDRFVHGHDHTAVGASSVCYNLDQDNDLGSPSFHVGSTTCLVSKEKPSVKANKLKQWRQERLIKVERRFEQVLAENESSLLLIKAAKNLQEMIKVMELIKPSDLELKIRLLQRTEQIIRQPSNALLLSEYLTLISGLPGHFSLSKAMYASFIIFLAITIASFLILLAINSFGVVTPLIGALLVSQSWGIAAAVLGVGALAFVFPGVSLIASAQASGMAKCASQLLWTTSGAWVEHRCAQHSESDLTPKLVIGPKDCEVQPKVSCAASIAKPFR